MRATFLSVPLLLVSACAPLLVQTSVPNPARAKDQGEVSQTYEVGPHKEDHQFEIALTQWTPTAIGARIKLTNIDDCALPRSYSYTLVDERNARFPFQPAGEPLVSSASGYNGRALKVTTTTGSFAAAIGPTSRTVVVQMRPVPGASCPAMDFRWDLQ